MPNCRRTIGDDSAMKWKECRRESKVSFLRHSVHRTFVD
jgi:hypothetical protein